MNKVILMREPGQLEINRLGCIKVIAKISYLMTQLKIFCRQGLMKVPTILEIMLLNTQKEMTFKMFRTKFTFKSKRNFFVRLTNNYTQFQYLTGDRRHRTLVALIKISLILSIVIRFSSPKFRIITRVSRLG